MRSGFESAAKEMGPWLIPNGKAAEVAAAGVVTAVKVARAGTKVALPAMKSSPFGAKFAGEIPRNGVPANWTREQIQDAIIDIRTSIVSRRAELAAFDAVGGGSATQRLAHARRIAAEEGFLRSLEKAVER
jgi:hypothetical protein